MRRINKIILHCTATKAGVKVTAADVDRWHKQQGWAGIGYHFLILLDGTIEKGRPIEKVGAHCTGQNANSIGVCYVGGLDAKGRAMDTRTPKQIDAMRELVQDLQRTFGCEVYGHNEFSNKACPCFNVQKEFRNGKNNSKTGGDSQEE